MGKRLARSGHVVDTKSASALQLHTKHVCGIVLLLVLLASLPSLSTAHAVREQLIGSAKQLSKNAVAAATPFLNVFQVYPPVLTPFSTGFGLTTGSAEDVEAIVPDQNSSCVTEQTLMVFSFANSYGMPFVGPYAPPADCDFNRVTLNITVTSAGRQFDRLGIVYFGDIEIWRTSTAEPTATGIVWTYTKDMSHLLALFRRPQTLIFDLGNLIDNTYTAPFNVTLTAAFFSSDNTVNPADSIVALSGDDAMAGMPSAFQVPPQDATKALTIPRNVNRAVFSIAATGQIDEEFWYTNVYSSEVATFNESGTTLLGYGPFREVQLYIDGALAGVVWPFPIIFTGGVVPGFWRPIVGIDAFDLREDEIDITPWLGVLCDGRSHIFDIKIAGIDDDGKGNGQVAENVGSYWVVTGKLFLWLDPSGAVTSGTRPSVSAPDPTIQISSSIGKTVNGTNQTLADNTHVQRQFSLNSTITTANGTSTPSWTQSLTYSNENQISSFGITQSTTQDISGTDMAPLRPYARKIDYPITVNTTFNQDPASNSLSISGNIDRGESISIAGLPVFPTGLQSFSAYPGVFGNGSSLQFQGSYLQTTQNGSAYYLNSPQLNVSSGTTQQDIRFSGFRNNNISADFPAVSGGEELYKRHVVAVNATVVDNEESLVGHTINDSGITQAAGPVVQDSWAGPNVMKVLGRGPGNNMVGTPGN